MENLKLRGEILRMKTKLFFYPALFFWQDVKIGYLNGLLAFKQARIKTKENKIRELDRKITILRKKEVLTQLQGNN